MTKVAKKRLSYKVFPKISRRLYKVFNDLDHTSGVLEIEEHGQGRKLYRSITFYGITDHKLILSGWDVKWVESRRHSGVFAIRVHRTKDGWGSSIYFPLVDQPGKRPRGRP